MYLVKNKFSKAYIAIFSCLLLFSFVPRLYAQEFYEPEISTGFLAKNVETSKEFMAVTANPLATKAAYDLLEKGASAVDAAIAAQLVLGLVEPQSSGLGGGAFALYYNAKTGDLLSFDGREAAPGQAGENLFLNQDGTKMDFHRAVVGGLSVGVPGTPALLEYLHQRYGMASWAGLFDKAIMLAEDGFDVSARLFKMIENDKGRLDRYEPARSYFYEDSSPKNRLRNPLYAKTLRHFRDLGSSYFYDSHSPQNLVFDMINTVRYAHDNPGLLSADDLADYTIRVRNPVCGEYRKYKVCSMGEPSSGALTIIQILGMIERFDLSAGPTPENVHLIAEASRLAFADRNKYIADADFVATPGLSLIDPEYLNKRSGLIDPFYKQVKVLAGHPDQEGGTSHISIIDSYGNILSMTTTIEGAFGSKLMVGGFLLNNELTDFSFEPGQANSVEGDKRPRSSMSPTIVFDPNGKPYLIIGSAGGSRIIGFVVQRLISLIDWNMNLQAALAMPHFLARSDVLELEPDLFFMSKPLEAYGHELKIVDMSSGLTAIRLKENAIIGAADPRREGLAMGQ